VSGDIAVAVPVVLGLFLSYIVGGYVAGRMAGYRTSWHGMMTAFFTLFILLVLMLLGVAADNGLFAASGIRSAADIIPGVRDLNLYALGDALTFGAILGFLAAIFGGWLGGLLAPTQAVAAVAPLRPVPVRAPVMARTVEKREVVTERPDASSRPSVARAASTSRRTSGARPMWRIGSKTGPDRASWT